MFSRVSVCVYASLALSSCVPPSVCLSIAFVFSLALFLCVCSLSTVYLNVCFEKIHCSSACASARGYFDVYVYA